eukprot:TRINITY_DN2369_c0_g1_i2.p1 TRINITY_DN2369_c0_g1~~TRINITY_DN2369_c0_g1_i2.p1  ORF type:complete len:532 (+),score=37.79 TRINITY_DN2369_c0_g1_i2:53-1597(+)
MALVPNNEPVTVDPDSVFRGLAAAIPQPAPLRKIHDVGSFHINALTRYSTQEPSIQYREPHDDQDIVEAVYRWDERPYEVIFRTGFRPRDQQGTSLKDFYDLERHVNGGGAPAGCAPADSAFVSTTRSTSWRPRLTTDTILYRYEIFAPGGIDTVLTLPRSRHNYRNQQEIAFVGGISPQYIRSARSFAAVVSPPGSQHPIYVPFGDRIYRNGLFNPNPTSLNEGQTTQEFTERLRNVRCGRNMMINVVFTRPHQHRIEKRDTKVDTTTLLVKEEPYVDPICSVGHYIECAFNFSNSKEAYLFIADRCLHINYAPNDKIINGPMSIGYGFPYLRDTIFASGIDAAFTSSKENEAYIFRNNIYALIYFVDGGGRIIYGPAKITDSFYSLKGTIFEHGLDAAFASSKKNEAYIFKGNQYALINFAPGTTEDTIIQGPKRITLGFPSLKETIFQEGFDAAFSSSRKHEAYIFKGNTYALINYAPGNTDDYIINGPITPISDGFHSLKNILPMYPCRC